MKRTKRLLTLTILFFVFVTLVNQPVVFSQTSREITVDDFDLFERVSQQKISNNGIWIAYQQKPAKGDGFVRVVNTKDGKEYTFERGTSPQFTDDSNWLKVTIVPHKKTRNEEREEEANKSDDKSKEKPKKEKNKMELLNLKTGERTTINEVANSKFSDDSKWVAYKKPKPEKNDKTKEKPTEDSKKSDKSKKKKTTGTDLIVRNLKDNSEIIISESMSYDFTKKSKFLYYVVASTDDAKDGLFVRDLSKGGNESQTLTYGKGKYEKFTWNEDKDKMLFMTDKDDQDSKKPMLSIYSWKVGGSSVEKAISSSSNPNMPSKMHISSYSPRWAKSGNSIIFHVKNNEPDEKPKLDGKKKASVDIWHWKDERIQPQQEIAATGESTGSTRGSRFGIERNGAYQMHLDLDTNKLTRVTNDDVDQVRFSPNDKYYIASDDSKYEWKRPYNSKYSDYSIVDLKTGLKTTLEKGTNWNYTWSSGSNYLLQYNQPHWYVYDPNTGEKRNLTENLKEAFWNTDDDRTNVKRSWGNAGWTQNDEGVILYDKYDMWYFPIAKAGDPVNLTKGVGRSTDSRFRYSRLDREEKFINTKDAMFVSYFNNKTKESGYYELKFGKDLKELIKVNKRISGVTKAKNAKNYMFNSSTNQESSNIWTTNNKFKTMEKISSANKNNLGFKWSTARLIDFTNHDGVKLQAVLKLPEGYEEGKRYPMIVYMYEKLSQNLHSYSAPTIGSGFEDSFYLSKGYLILRPDIVYTAGYPGPSAVKAIVPAAQKVIDMGIADEEKIGLTGHSWGGYQIAYITTQTNMFAAAYTGAPVVNMTSAYGGIRWGSGNPRTFQYETGQSRLGGNLWEVPERYIENSPLFFLDRVETPILMAHGDNDTAVPWYQSIEYFLGLRRLDKPVWFLQYNGEAHGWRSDANGRDISTRRAEFFDHYLMGQEMPLWMKYGVKYTDKGIKGVKGN